MPTGRNQPPTAIALRGTKVACGFELRSRSPTTIFVAARRSGMGGQLGVFIFRCLPKSIVPLSLPFRSASAN
jgi:hypothetical protein